MLAESGTDDLGSLTTQQNPYQIPSRLAVLGEGKLSAWHRQTCESLRAWRFTEIQREDWWARDVERLPDVSKSQRSLGELLRVRAERQSSTTPGLGGQRWRARTLGRSLRSETTKRIYTLRQVSPPSTYIIIISLTLIYQFGMQYQYFFYHTVKLGPSQWKTCMLRRCPIAARLRRALRYFTGASCHQPGGIG